MRSESIEVLVVVGVMICIAGFFAVRYLAQVHEYRPLREAFRAVAFQRDGFVESREILGLPSGLPAVRFMHGRAQMLLDVCDTSSGGLYFIQLHLVWREKQLRFEVYPETFTQSVGKLLGAPDLVIGSPAFDRDFIIRGNDRRRIAKLLTESVQARISDLCRWLDDNDIYVAARGGTMIIKKRNLPYDAETVEQFVAMGLELYDDICGLGREEIELIYRDEASFSLHFSDAICQVCGEPFTSETVFCRCCKTLHHEDCWLYNGKCSTYGCGERNFVRSRHDRVRQLFGSRKQKNPSR